MLPKESTDILVKWLLKNRYNSYPSEDEKNNLARNANLTPLQVVNWLMNARWRILPKIIQKDGLDPSLFLKQKMENEEKEENKSNVKEDEDFLKSKKKTNIIFQEFQLSFMCNLCSKYFNSDLNLKRHITQAHEKQNGFKFTASSYKIGKPKPNICQLCNIIFREFSSLQDHLDNVHKSNRNYECDKCGKIFEKQFNLKIHIDNVHKEYCKESNCVTIKTTPIKEEEEYICGMSSKEIQSSNQNDLSEKTNENVNLTLKLEAKTTDEINTISIDTNELNIKAENLEEVHELKSFNQSNATSCDIKYNEEIHVEEEKEIEIKEEIGIKEDFVCTVKPINIKYEKIENFKDSNALVKSSNSHELKSLDQSNATSCNIELHEEINIKEEFDITEDIEVKEDVVCNVKPIDIKCEKIETFKDCFVLVKPLDAKRVKSALISSSSSSRHGNKRINSGTCIKDPSNVISIEDVNEVECLNVFNNVIVDNSINNVGKKSVQNSNIKSKSFANSCDSLSVEEKDRTCEYLPRKRRINLPFASRKILKEWLFDNRKSPYPTEKQKEQLALKTNLNVNQVNNWLINARRRSLPEIMQEEGMEPSHVLIKKKSNNKKIKYENKK